MVILIILATVTINATFGENGLIKQAEKTKDLANNFISKEESDMNKLLQEYANMMAEDSKPPLPEDTTPPTVNIIVGEVTENSIVITVNAIDDSGEVVLYKYYLNGTEKATSESNSYTFTELTEGTQYTIKVEAFDKVGNKGEKSTTVSTIIYPTVQEKLKEGDYVNYVDAKGITRKCAVLFDNTSVESNNKIHIISMNKVEDITLGSTDFTTSMNLYNNVINILNDKSEEYNNSIYSNAARCVGSIPDNPNYDGAVMHTSQQSYMEEYNAKLKSSDSNYRTDYEQLKLLNLENINCEYWLASRMVHDNEYNVIFGLWTANKTGSVFLQGAYVLVSIFPSGTLKLEPKSAGLRPVFVLKSNIKVTGGNGTEASPYTLGV